MKKRIIPLVLLLAMLLSLPAYAASPRVMTILPAISFDGTTANCRVSVSADRSTDQISAVIQLWNGSTRIARWTDSGTGYLLFSNSATVSKGKTYELTVDRRYLQINYNYLYPSITWFNDFDESCLICEHQFLRGQHAQKLSGCN